MGEYGVRAVRWAARGPAAGRDRRPRRTLGWRSGGGPCGGAPRRRLDTHENNSAVLIKKCGRDIGLTTYQALFSQVTSLKDEVFR
ncbi:hypothetical protein ABZ194_11325, partial [Streptosporangium sp. NPDC006007]